MPLTVKQIENAAPPEPPRKQVRLSDGAGLYLQIEAIGGRYWRWKYRHDGKEKLLALGVFPEVGLAAARAKRDEARALLKHGTDPNAAKRAAKQAAQAPAIDHTFRGLAQDWLASLESKRAPQTMGKNRWVLGYLLPAIGHLPIDEVTPKVLADVLQPVAAKAETANRIKKKVGEIFRWGIVQGRASHDPTLALRQHFVAPTAKHHAARIAPAAIGALLRAIDGYQGEFTTLAALKLAPMLFLRPGELRNGRWSEVELEQRPPVWRIPGHRMKGVHSKHRPDHIVPLASQAVAILTQLRRLTGNSEYMFPGVRSGRPISENTVNAALKSLGIRDQVGHGFRTTASTQINEHGEFNRDAIERQLAHVEGNKVRAAYLSAEYLTERIEMMQWYADYLDWLKAGMPEGGKPVRRKYA